MNSWRIEGYTTICSQRAEDKKLKNITKEEIKDIEDKIAVNSGGSVYDELLKQPLASVNRIGIYFFCSLIIAAAALLYFGEIDVMVSVRGIMRPVESTYKAVAQANGIVAAVPVRKGDYKEKDNTIIAFDFSRVELGLKEKLREFKSKKRQLQKEKKARTEATLILADLEGNLPSSTGKNLSGQIGKLFFSLKDSFSKMPAEKSLDYNQTLVEFKEAHSKLQDTIESLEIGVENISKDIQLLKGQLDKREIKMPFNGFVSELNVTTGGQSVKMGEVVAELLPEDATLEIEAKILNKDIGLIKPDMDAVVKIDAFPFQEFGTVNAKVVTVLPNIKGEDSFSIQMELARQTLIKNDQEFKFIPGMTINVDIITRKVRVYQFLFQQR